MPQGLYDTESDTPCTTGALPSACASNVIEGVSVNQRNDNMQVLHHLCMRRRPLQPSLLDRTNETSSRWKLIYFLCIRETLSQHLQSYLQCLHWTPPTNHMLHSYSGGTMAGLVQSAARRGLKSPMKPTFKDITDPAARNVRPHISLSKRLPLHPYFSDRRKRPSRNACSIRLTVA